MEWMLMPLRRYADFSGRARRKEYWMWMFFLLLVFVAYSIFVFIRIAMSADRTGPPSAGEITFNQVVTALVWLPLLVPSWAVAVRRMHDLDRTGWWVLAPAAAYLAVVVARLSEVSSALSWLASLASIGSSLLLLVFYLQEGTRGPNRYGPDPKSRDLEQGIA